MSGDRERLTRWLRRAQPPRAQLARALLAGLVASITNVALLVGAVALLVESATRPGLHAVAIVLIVIELFAFLRSPLRFVERLTAHRLGYAAVTRWRQWLVVVIGQLDYSQWRSYAAGDLLERALSDTDQLQDLWLRSVVPFVDVVTVMVLGDLVVAGLPPFGHWWASALTFFIFQILGVAGLLWCARIELVRDRELRSARGNFRAQLVELSAVTPELVLLQREHLAGDRLSAAVRQLDLREEALRRQRHVANIVVITASVASLCGVFLRPASSTVWLVVATVIGLSSYEALNSLRAATQSAVEVSGGGERLDALDVAVPRGTASWPGDPTIRLIDVTVEEEDHVLVRGATLTIVPGSHLALVGESGVGKSTLLRALAALDDVASGTILVGDIELSAIDEGELRRHVAYVVSEPGFTRGFAIDVVSLGRPSTRDPHADLGSLGLVSNQSTRFDELSRGERVRVAVARSLVTNPDILLLDEPTSGLGQDETSRVLMLLGATNSTVVVATHDPEVIAWCDDVVELRDGQLQRVNR